MSTADSLYPFVYVLAGALALFLFAQSWNWVRRQRTRIRVARPQSELLVIPPAPPELSSQQESQWNLLTVREKQVAGFAARGLSNSEIAFRLRISSGTVDTHLKNTYSKLDVHSRTELAYKFRDLVDRDNHHP